MHGPIRLIAYVIYARVRENVPAQGGDKICFPDY